MENVEDTKPFPIQEEHRDRKNFPRSTVPWWLAEIAYEYYAECFGKQQSLECLAKRGGFGRTELVMLIRRDVKF